MMMLRRRHNQQVGEIKQQALEIARLESENEQLKHQIASIRVAAVADVARDRDDGGHDSCGNKFDC
jgi:hypothetical protein